MKFFIGIFFISVVSANAQMEEITVLDSGYKTSLRGLCVVDDNIIWVSGSNGTVAKSVNAGKTFEWLTIKGYEKRDFRDIEAFDANTAIIMAAAEPAIILKTKDGGKNWYRVFEDTTKGMFLDAMDFNWKYGVIIGDPIKNKLFLAITEDNGEHWAVQNNQQTFATGEAFFASSGTNIKIINTRHTSSLLYSYVSGGTKSAYYYGNEILLPVTQGKESTGANSMDCLSEKNLVVVGGDFLNDKDTTGNCALSENFGQNWFKPQTPPHGYRSCVKYITEKNLITCGTSGVDISTDGGLNWQLISLQSFHVCQKAKKGDTIFLAGANGKIARLNNF